MFRVLPDLIASLRAALPPWAFVLVLLALGAALSVPYFYWLRGKQIKGKFRSYGRAKSDAERRRLADEIFVLTGARARLLVTVAEEAQRLGMKVILDRALAILDHSGEAREDVRRLRVKITQEKPPPMHPLEEAVHVERMLGEGLLPAARGRLDRALNRFPDDVDLLELCQRLKAAEASAQHDVESVS